MALCGCALHAEDLHSFSPTSSKDGAKAVYSLSIPCALAPYTAASLLKVEAVHHLILL